MSYIQRKKVSDNNNDYFTFNLDQLNDLDDYKPLNPILEELQKDPYNQSALDQLLEFDINDLYEHCQWPDLRLVLSTALLNITNIIDTEIHYTLVLIHLRFLKAFNSYQLTDGIKVILQYLSIQWHIDDKPTTNTNTTNNMYSSKIIDIQRVCYLTIWERLTDIDTELLSKDMCKILSVILLLLAQGKIYSNDNNNDGVYTSVLESMSKISKFRSIVCNYISRIRLPYQVLQLAHQTGLLKVLLTNILAYTTDCTTGYPQVYSMSVQLWLTLLLPFARDKDILEHMSDPQYTSLKTPPAAAYSEGTADEVGLPKVEEMEGSNRALYSMTGVESIFTLTDGFTLAHTVKVLQEKSEAVEGVSRYERLLLTIAATAASTSTVSSSAQVVVSNLNVLSYIVEAMKTMTLCLQHCSYLLDYIESPSDSTYTQSQCFVASPLQAYQQMLRCALKILKHTSFIYKSELYTDSNQLVMYDLCIHHEILYIQLHRAIQNFFTSTYSLELGKGHNYDLMSDVLSILQEAVSFFFDICPSLTTDKTMLHSYHIYIDLIDSIDIMFTTVASIIPNILQNPLIIPLNSPYFALILEQTRNLLAYHPVTAYVYDTLTAHTAYVATSSKLSSKYTNKSYVNKIRRITKEECLVVLTTETVHELFETIFKISNHIRTSHHAATIAVISQLSLILLENYASRFSTHTSDAQEAFELSIAAQSALFITFLLVEPSILKSQQHVVSHICSPDTLVRGVLAYLTHVSKLDSAPTHKTYDYIVYLLIHALHHESLDADGLYDGSRPSLSALICLLCNLSIRGMSDLVYTVISAALSEVQLVSDSMVSFVYYCYTHQFNVSIMSEGFSYILVAVIYFTARNSLFQLSLRQFASATLSQAPNVSLAPACIGDSLASLEGEDLNVMVEEEEGKGNCSTNGSGLIAYGCMSVDDLVDLDPTTDGVETRLYHIIHNILTTTDPPLVEGGALLMPASSSTNDSGVVGDGCSAYSVYMTHMTSDEIAYELNKVLYSYDN